MTSADPSAELKGAAGVTSGEVPPLGSVLKDVGGKLLQKVLDIVLRERIVTGMDASSQKVIEFRHPQELMVRRERNIMDDRQIGKLET